MTEDDREPNVHNGMFTVEHPDHGKHFTLKLYTAKAGDFAGKRIIALLSGPNNESDYKGVAFWDDERRRPAIWRRYRSGSSVNIDGYTWSADWSIVEQKVAIWTDLVVRGATDEQHGYWYGSGFRLLKEGRCVKCNRVLTDPESIRRGVGPECWKRMSA